MIKALGAIGKEDRIRPVGPEPGDEVGGMTIVAPLPAGIAAEIDHPGKIIALRVDSLLILDRTIRYPADIPGGTAKITEQPRPPGVSS